MEASQTNNEIPNPSLNVNSISLSSAVWPTIDGPLGLSEEESLSYASKFYKFGFALLPWLWAVNCFYFWPVLFHRRSFPSIHHCSTSDLEATGSKGCFVDR
ncbi:probable gamma-secretase subunit PEN-2 isoform X2 [Ziziphus jujuba]|uniref:Probable gamma-secretase subunit PEN-2 isoform X2 n=1 Tax=Ziziphus jujuba TaxID=326968 RepID=A0ABM3IUH2_ZIZJJ|nr:probable gamma-secretase subunit PEN-2 isoform X2 [Ziziphus jujuba]